MLKHKKNKPQYSENFVKPVFVIGKNRSGTKWLSNIIANHPDIACVQREGAGGIVETNIFSNFPALFGDLRYEENYFGMAVCFSQTNFFRLTGLNEGVLYENRKENYLDLFRYVMNLYSKRGKKTYWLQKAAVDDFENIYNFFPDARFIVVERDIVDNIRSTRGLAKLNDKPVPGIIREIAKWHLAQKTTRRYQAESNVMHVTFDQLKNDRQNLVKKVCDFLELTFHESMLIDTFKKNTSFQKGIKKEDMLSSFQIRIVRVLTPLFRVVPFFVLRGLGSLMSRKGTGQRLVAKSFSLLREDYGCEND